MRAVGVTSTRLVARSGLLLPNALVWPVHVASAVQRVCDSPDLLAQRALPATVTGHTTPAVRDVGGASLRIAFDDMHAVPLGGYLLALRPRVASGSFPFRPLPAIAAIPGRSGPDREQMSREGLAELVILCRPILPAAALQNGEGKSALSRRQEEEEGSNMEGAEQGESAVSRRLEEGAERRLAEGSEEQVTFLHHQALLEMYPLGSQVEVDVVAKVEDFFVGLNAGTWLKIRMKQIAESAARHLEGLPAAGAPEGASIEQLLRGTGLVALPEVEEAESDQEWLFNDNPGGNTGVSGQMSFDPASTLVRPRLSVDEILRRARGKT